MMLRRELLFSSVGSGIPGSSKLSGSLTAVQQTEKRVGAGKAYGNVSAFGSITVPHVYELIDNPSSGTATFSFIPSDNFWVAAMFMITGKINNTTLPVLQGICIGRDGINAPTRVSSIQTNYFLSLPKYAIVYETDSSFNNIITSCRSISSLANAITETEFNQIKTLDSNFSFSNTYYAPGTVTSGSFPADRFVFDAFGFSDGGTYPIELEYKLVNLVGGGGVTNPYLLCFTASNPRISTWRCGVVT